MNKFHNYIKNKKVVVVGPAPSIIGSNQGEEIDSYDIVVRINKALPIPENLKQDIGNKTNVLFNCLNISPDNGGYLHIPMLMQKLDWIASPYAAVPPFDGDIRRFNDQLADRIPFFIPDISWYLNIEKEMGTRPNSGILAILCCANFEPSELYVTGFTFFKGGYYKEYRQLNEQQVMHRMAQHGNHRQEPQIEFFKKYVATKSFIKMDKDLIKILGE